MFVGTEGAMVDQRGAQVRLDANVENNANLGAMGVRGTTFDQSHAKIHVKGKRGGKARVNHYEGCQGVHVVQDNVIQHIEGGGDNSETTVDYVKDTEGFRCDMSNSTTLIDGRNSARNSITAGRIIQGNSSVIINESNTTTIIRS